MQTPLNSNPNPSFPGDKQTFEQVFRQYYPYLCSYACQIIHDKDDAEEIVQELFVQMWQNRESLVIQSSVKAYLFRSVHNSCLNHIKHHNVKDAYAKRVIRENPEAGQITFNTGDTRDLQKKIQSAVEQLPPERKKVFLMIRYEERRYKEVAEILGISVKTVESQMAKAMQFLKKALNEYLSLFIVIILSFISFFFISNR